jgi:hypothetical protein
MGKEFPIAVAKPGFAGNYPMPCRNNFSLATNAAHIGADGSTEIAFGFNGHKTRIRG